MTDLPPLRTTLPDARRTPRFAGVPTFCRYPRLEDVPDHQRPVDWALYGIPYDGGVTYRPGAKFGPRAIRDASQYVKPVHLEHGLDLVRTYSLADAGDAPVSPYDCKETLDAACEYATTIADAGHTRLMAVGGDHSIAYANIRATWTRQGRPAKGLALLHFDAHLDTVDTVWGEKWTHASPFIRAIEDGLIDPERMLSVGIRGPLNAASDLDYASTHGIEIVTYDDWRHRDGNDRISRFIKQLDDDPVYLTFDIDSIDPSAAPGTGTPCPGGFTAPEAFDLLRSCAGVNLVGADLVEVLPDRDVADMTAMLAAHIMFEILCLPAAPRR